VPYAWGHDLGEDRHVDFGPDRKPIGIALLNVSMGVDIKDLPEQEAVARLLAKHNIPMLAAPASG
jgi:hypothetical protein